jgi:hemerythrin
MALLFEWRDKYSVKIMRFDNAHKKIIDLMNEIHDIIKLKKDQMALEKVMNELYTYTKTHFNDEINLMEQYEYPELELHKIEHNKFISELDKIKEKLGNQANLLNIQLMYILKNWLINHIMVTDMKYSEFFLKINADEI